MLSAARLDVLWHHENPASFPFSNKPDQVVVTEWLFVQDLGQSRPSISYDLMAGSIYGYTKLFLPQQNDQIYK